MKVVWVALIVVLGAAWAKNPAQSVHAGTVRTSKGDMKILNVYHGDNPGAFGQNLTELGNSMAPRIINGADVADIRDFPQVVALYFLDQDPLTGYSYLFCTGSIVDEYIVLTAAHCFFGLPTMTDSTYLLACSGWRTRGEFASVVFQTCAAMSSVYIPEGYNNEEIGGGYDMAVAGLWTSILGGRVRRTKFALAKPRNLTPVFMVGFGLYGTDGEIFEGSDGWMRFASGSLFLNEGMCRILSALDLGMNSALICVDDRFQGGCLGDSGGPLLVNKGGKGKNNRQIGIMSFGAEDCDLEHNWETVYTSLYNIDHKRIFRYVVKEIFGGSFKRVRL